MSLALVPIASRYLFAARSGLRIIEAGDTHCFKTFKDLTREQVSACPSLADLLGSADVPMYISEYSGIPGIVKGASQFATGITVFTEDLKYMTVVDNSRVSENKIKFNHGSSEIKERRENCWEFCVKRQQITIITEIEKSPPSIFPVVITRETECPICDDTLCRAVVTCKAMHQICLPCYNLMQNTYGNKKCPLCNKANYSEEELQKVELMNGLEIEKEPYIYLDLYSGGNSFKDYVYDEALFYYMLKSEAKYCNMDIYRTMLLSSLCNFYMNHTEKFGSYNFNFTHYANDNNRSLRPYEDDVGDVITHYVETVYDPEKFKSIYDDVAYTNNIYTAGYDDRIFHPHLLDIEGNINRIVDYPNENKAILMREIYFRYKVKHSNKNEMKLYFKNIIARIIQNLPRANINSLLYKYVRKEI
jgi:hypothetical protein